MRDRKRWIILRYCGIFCAGVALLPAAQASRAVAVARNPVTSNSAPSNAAHSNAAPSNAVSTVQMTTTSRALKAEEFASLELRRLNVQLSPISWLVGRSNVSIDFGVTNALTLGPRFTYADHAPARVFDEETGTEVGVRANYFLNRARYTDGFLLKPAVYYADLHRHEGLRFFSDTESKTKGAVFELLAAYQLHLKGGLNFEWAVGAKSFRDHRRSVDRSLFSSEVPSPPRLSSRRQTPVVVELNVGYAF